MVFAFIPFIPLQYGTQIWASKSYPIKNTLESFSIHQRLIPIFFSYENLRMDDLLLLRFDVGNVEVVLAFRWLAV